MSELFERLSAFDSKPALMDRDRVITYRELSNSARAFAEKVGSVRRLIFLEAANTPDSISAYLGCLMGGHAVLLLEATSNARSERLSTIYRPNYIVRCRKSDANSELLKCHDDPIALHPSLRVLLATSGSTGSPKLVKLSTTNLDSNAASIAQYLELDSTERAITSLKFNYSYGMSVLNSHFRIGGALILTDKSVTDQGFWELYRRHEATSFAGVPYTFEALAKMGEGTLTSRHLRYVTQAGGRLSESLVKQFSALSAKNRWRFYVMYGQTEASPRISYVPPEAVSENADCIGVPIPGGRMFLLDERGEEIPDSDSPGELAYMGPNVMMGYAQNVSDLSSDNTPRLLMTGDIACRRSNGMYCVVGRTNRFVKPFGVRVSLDDVEQRIRQWAPEAVCTGKDENILLALLPKLDQSEIAERMEQLGAEYGLPPVVFRAVVFDEIPRLQSGKPDYQSILNSYGASTIVKEATVGRIRAWVLDPAATLFSSRFAKQLVIEAEQLFGIGQRQWKGIADIYSTVLRGQVVGESDNFKDLAGDSLSYVQASVAIEEYLGRLPTKWEQMTVGDLEKLRTKVASL